MKLLNFVDEFSYLFDTSSRYREQRTNSLKIDDGVYFEFIPERKLGFLYALMARWRR